ncbi:MAG: ABC transporter permease subunit [Paludisphaera borealis]|uniref:ABC transporter permease n=1 Tax=Paludisphaera borealis TaxID=1387353 RepID=UPI002850B719|nr:ABC transporter permease subunit [Paludisphaera borealis]MDR3620886.1 ABC transporter permease subunit [Paludisphaera borealis]
MSAWASWTARVLVIVGLAVLIGWPLAATIVEAVGVAETASDSSGGLDPAATAAVVAESGGLARPARLAFETVLLAVASEALALPVGVALALLLFRTDVWGRRPLLFLLGLAAFIPLPLHATAWLGAFGNAGRMQAIGVQPILVGRLGVAVITALAALPWVVLLSGIGLRLVEPELEEGALLDWPAWRVWLGVTLRRSLGAVAASALAVAVLAAGDMTVTDLLQVRTYAEEAYVQFTLGNGPASAAAVAIPPLLVLGTVVLVVCRSLARHAPRRLASAFERSKTWRLGRWRVPLGIFLVALVGNIVALPLYSLIWRAGRVGGRATLGKPPTWSLAGLGGSLRFAFEESVEPLTTSVILSLGAATLTVMLAWAICWLSRASRGWQALTLGVVALTLAAPGPVVGMALLLAYRTVDWVYDSPLIVVFAMSVRALPYAILILWPFLRSLPTEVFEAAAMDGVGPIGEVFCIAIPLSRRATLAAWAVAFVLSLGELPATNLITPPGTQTISLLIWSLLHTGVESHLAAVALVTLAAIAAAGLIAVWLLQRAVARPRD